MSDFDVTKIEAARRQIDTAIELHFDEKDPIPVHTLAFAGLRLVLDLSRRSQTSAFEKINAAIEKVVIPEMKGKFWGGEGMAKAANFLKHADRDHDAELADIDVTVNDHFLFFACLLFPDHGEEWTVEMRILLVWYASLYPDCFPHDAPWGRPQLRDFADSMAGKSRSEQLELGRMGLAAAKKSGLFITRRA